MEVEAMMEMEMEFEMEVISSIMGGSYIPQYRRYTGQVPSPGRIDWWFISYDNFIVSYVRV